MLHVSGDERCGKRKFKGEERVDRDVSSLNFIRDLDI